MSNTPLEAPPVMGISAVLRNRTLRIAVAFSGAAIVAGLLGSFVQTGANLAALSRMGASVPLALGAAMAGEDALRFGPVMAALAAAAFLPAFLAAWLVARWQPNRRALVFAVAGAVGLWAAFTLMGFFTPMPTLFAAARGVGGLLALCACGLAGGALFAWASATRRSAV